MLSKMQIKNSNEQKIKNNKNGKKNVYHNSKGWNRRYDLRASQIDKRHDPVYVSLLDGNIQAAPLLSTLPSLQRTTAKGSRIQLHTTATPPTTAQKQVCNTLGNYVYISKFTKCISLAWTCQTRHFHTWLGNIKAICSRYMSLKTWADLFFLFKTHTHLQSRTGDQYLQLSY